MRVLYANMIKQHVKLLLSGDEVNVGDFQDAEAVTWHASRSIGLAKVRTADGITRKAVGIEWLELASGGAVEGLSKCANGACDVIKPDDVMVGLNIADAELFAAVLAGEVAVEINPSGVTLSAHPRSPSRKATARAATSPGDLILHAIRAGQR